MDHADGPGALWRWRPARRAFSGRMALKEKLDARRPPDLRRGDAKHRCGICVHFGRGECLKYGWRVRPTELCNSFAPVAREGSRG